MKAFFLLLVCVCISTIIGLLKKFSRTNEYYLYQNNKFNTNNEMTFHIMKLDNNNKHQRQQQRQQHQRALDNNHHQQHQQQPQQLLDLQLLLNNNATSTVPTTTTSRPVVAVASSTSFLSPSFFNNKRHECLEMVSFEGYVMQDSINCWNDGNQMLLKTSESTSTSTSTGQKQQNYYEIIEMDIQKMLENQEIYVMGDSLARFMFAALLGIVDQKEPIFKWTPKEFHGKITRKVGKNTLMNFVFVPTAKQIRDHLIQMKEQSKSKKNNIMTRMNHTLIMYGIWDTNPKYYGNAVKLANYIIVESNATSEFQDLTIQTAAPVQLNVHKNDEILAYNMHVASLFSNHSKVKVLDGFWRFQVTDSDGSHSLIHAYHSAYRYLWSIYWQHKSNNKNNKSNKSNKNK